MSGKRAEDIEEIRALSYRYVLGLDVRRPGEATEVFTDDASFDASAVGLSVIKGKPAITEFFENEVESMEAQAHFSTNHLVAFQGDNVATGTNYLLADGLTRDGGRLRVTILNSDEYVRTGEGWKIASRTIQPLTPPDLGGLSL